MSHALESLTARAYPRRLNPAKGVEPARVAGRESVLRHAGDRGAEDRRRASRARGQRCGRHRGAHRDDVRGHARRHRVQRRRLPPAARLVLRRVRARRKDWHVHGYPEGKTLVPHGMAVVLNNPSVWRFTAPLLSRSGICTARSASAPRRAARRAADAGEILAQSRDRTDARDRRCRTASPRSASTRRISMRSPPAPSRSTA